MNGEWTYSNLDQEWVHETFKTKEKAIEAGKKKYDHDFFVGQLAEKEEPLNYMVINEERVAV